MAKFLMEVWWWIGEEFYGGFGSEFGVGFGGEFGIGFGGSVLSKSNLVFTGLGSLVVETEIGLGGFDV